MGSWLLLRGARVGCRRPAAVTRRQDCPHQALGDSAIAHAGGSAGSDRLVIAADVLDALRTFGQVRFETKAISFREFALLILEQKIRDLFAGHGRPFSR